MLQIQNIRKQYITGELVQTALDDVSLSFREHELVAILGPSGSGKSTLLNVIGGLDHYDSGDLIINGISTKQYTDRDWDSYRNHTVGFIFQSYNLIPHQNVLSNVELALTISGVPASERKRRAIEALENVGLGNQLHKKPNQMSGGQMQRVAIARALVNNPKILLADEPTGALDSETSIQVMELLKEVAKDRLVVMVTHNPELAQQYASRIVRVKDGRILDDSDPYTPETVSREPPRHKNMGHSSMSFRAALVLSFQNLWTKKTRTLLTAFAGSIGIIGIALILSLSAGFQAYIDNIQRDTLASYPLTLTSETADMSSVFMSAMVPPPKEEERKAGVIQESQILAKMFAHIGVNDLASFKDHIEENQDTVKEMVNSIQYGYGIEPRIYTDNPEDPLQVNPAALFLRITGNEAFSAMMDSDAFQQLSEDQQMIDEQYDLVSGRWPREYNELVFILPKGGMLPDNIAFTLGLKNMGILDHMLELMEDGKDIPQEEDMEWAYEEILKMTYRWVPVPELYRYNEEFSLWEDMSEDPEFLSEAVKNGTELRVVGIIEPKKGNSGIYYPGIGYLQSFTEHVIENASHYEIVKDQLANPDVDVFSGVPFNGDGERDLPDMESLITVDGNAIASAFGVDISEQAVSEVLQKAMNEMSDVFNRVDTTGAKADFLSTFSDLGFHMLGDYVEAHGGTAVITTADIEPMVDSFLSGDYASTKIASLADRYDVSASDFYEIYRPLLTAMVANFIAQEIENGTAQVPSLFAPSRPSAPGIVLTSENLGELIPVIPETPEANLEEAETPPPLEENGSDDSEVPAPPDFVAPPDGELPEPEGGTPDTGDQAPTPDTVSALLTRENISSAVLPFLADPAVGQAADAMAMKMMETTIVEEMAKKAAGMDDDLSRLLRSSFHVDSSRLESAFRFNMDEEKLHRMFETLINGEKARSALDNLQKLGYADLEKPTYMGVFMKDFDGKEAFVDFLDAYNRDMEESDQEEKVVQYTDMTGQMMNSVRIIIDSVSYVLIAFVAVSLVVSSIMIGIITYISVMERTKEIGVLRAMGASKHNISQVFNAETFIIGLTSGILGILISLGLLIPGNMVLHRLTGNVQIAAKLPVVGAVILVFLSMLLTVIGGLIPSKQAAKKDPVTALRSE